ncbi:MAG: hypothetical protein M1816_005610 [Peltula sp. TS41687]|nr:MAG: hypothetical protein M1816_005610 [Peltula sp. TS41687]
MASEVEVITTISPTTNKSILTRHGLHQTGVSLLSAKATKAFSSYRTTKLPERQEIIKKALQIMEREKDTLARELTEQMGRPIAYTPKEISTAVARGEYLVKMSDDALKITPGQPENGFKRYIKKEPVGVVLIIFAWNYPYLILVNALIPALLAGNSVILKPSPQTPTVAEHVKRIFEEAGLPEDVIQYFHCGSPVLVEWMVESCPQVNLISFTGSVPGGLSVQRAASGRVVPVCLELGGKDPAYVRADVDVDWAAEEVVDGSIFNSGQSCCSIERVYVHADVHDQFVKAAQNALKKYRLGDPFDKSIQIGPVISKKAAETIRSHIADAVEQGAVDVTPDNESFTSPPPDGNFVPPTLLINVNHNMNVMTEETFGPIIPIMKVQDDAEAIQLMNDSKFGLTASIWTKDVAKGEELAEVVEAGTVFVNRSDFPSPDLAWTGWKDSGKGVTLSQFGFDQFVKLKSFHLKDYPNVEHKPTGLESVKEDRERVPVDEFWESGPEYSPFDALGISPEQEPLSAAIIESTFFLSSLNLAQMKEQAGLRKGYTVDQMVQAATALSTGNCSGLGSSGADGALQHGVLVLASPGRV